MNDGQWEFYTRIAEESDTMRRHHAEFAKAHLGPAHADREPNVNAGMLSYHLRQAETFARSLAGPRPAAVPSIDSVENSSCRHLGVFRGSVCEKCGVRVE